MCSFKMTNVACLIFTLLALFSYNRVQSLNILASFPYEGKSHFFVFQPYLIELAKRGHNVTVISHFPQKSPIENYHDISLAGKSKVLESHFSLERSYLNILLVSLFLVNFGTMNCKILMEDENVQNLWKTKTKFDVVVTEQFNSDCSLGLAYKLGAPVVGITSHKIMPWHTSRFGIGYNPSYMPFMFLEGGTKPTLYQRVERTVLDAYFKMLYKYFCQRADDKTIAQYIDNVPPLEELAKEIKMFLLYQNFVMVGSDSLPSNIKEIGGLHVAKPKPLPDNLRKFIEESKHGVIYVSFGSMLKANTLPKEKVAAIIDTLSKLPQSVLLKWEDSTLPGNPKNIFVSNWMPQNDILAHPNVVAFYSHCGMLGTTEAMHHGVPMVAMPIFGDQPANAAAVEESGLGVQIQLNELNKEKLLEKFKIVLDPKFRENVKQLSKAWHDRPLSAMDSAIFWTEFAARNANLSLKSPAVEVPYYQYLCLDVLLVLLVPIFLVVCIFKYLLTLITRQPNKKSKIQ